MTKMLRKWFRKPITIVPLVLVATLVSLAAGRVNGLYLNVDSTQGYTINGSAGGNAGYAACTSTGSKIDSFCSLAGATLFYQTITSSIATLPQEPVLHFTGSFTAVDNSTISTIVDLASVATAGTTNCPSAFTIDAKGRVLTAVAGTCPIATVGTGTNGSYTATPVTVSGTPETLYDEDVDTGALGNNTTTTVTLPHSIPATVLSIVCSDNSSRVQSGNTQAIGANVAGQSAPFTSIQVLTSATGENASCRVRGY